MKTLFRSALVIGVLIAISGSCLAFIFGSGSHTTIKKQQLDVDIDSIYQVVNTNVDAVSYVTIYGVFSDPTLVSVVDVGTWTFQSSLYYWDESMMVIRLVSQGPRYTYGTHSTLIVEFNAFGESGTPNAYPEIDHIEIAAGTLP